MRQEITLGERAIRNYWRKVQKFGENECWIWIGGTPSDGYGAFTVNGRQHVATHIALVLDGKPRPDAPYDLALHGDCSNPACVNPRHLRWGNAHANAQDRMRLDRNNFARGEQSGSNKLTEEQVRYIRTCGKTGVALAKELGVSTATISLVKNRMIWTHI